MKQYQPLYLKYRPQKLSELIGQEVVTKTLSNAITYNKIVHAYLFCGPRGTGKTSTARILAKSLNCEKGTTVDPCGKCTSCHSITIGNSLDVIEIDAASHRKVEDAEDLINRVSLGTYGSRFKIYIIDEVHMLTDHAFNALLKTLEEPPKNVIFILATTEEYKVIPTIISRCQKLEFKPVFQTELEKRIRAVASEEKINIDDSIVDFISKRSHGCLRDAISLLDQISVLQNENKPISPKEVFELFGTVDRNTLFNLLVAVLGFKRKNAVDLAEELIKSGKDIGELFKNLLELIIDLGKAKIDSEYKKILSTELNNDLKLLENITHGHLLKIIDRLHDSQSKLRFALSQELQFMVEIMSMIDEDFLISVTELKERVKKLEIEKGIGNKVNVGSNELKTVKTTVKEEIIKPQDLKTLEAQDFKTSGLQDLDFIWKNTVSLIESNPTKTLLMQSGSYLLNLTDEIIEIGLSKDMFLPRLEQDTKKKEMLLKAVKLASNKEPKVIRFRIMPRENPIQFKAEPVLSLTAEEQIITSTEVKKTPVKSHSDNEFTAAIKDLLGAKEID